MFEVKYRDGMGRLGELHTPHGVIETPTVVCATLDVTECLLESTSTTITAGLVALDEARDEEGARDGPAQREVPRHRSA